MNTFSIRYSIEFQDLNYIDRKVMDLEIDSVGNIRDKCPENKMLKAKHTQKCQQLIIVKIRSN